MKSRHDPAGPYGEFERSGGERVERAREGLLRLASDRPQAVASVIERAITVARPRARYVVPGTSRLFVASYRWLPDRLWDALMRRIYHTPGSANRA